MKKLLIHRFEMITFRIHAAGSEVIDSPQPAWERCGEGRIGAEKGDVEKIHLIDLTIRYARFIMSMEGGQKDKCPPYKDINYFVKNRIVHKETL